jgi:hypothetical protein
MNKTFSFIVAFLITTFFQIKWRIVMKLKSFLVLFFIAFVPISAAADVWVYDANNQKVGILLGIKDDSLEVFLPSLKQTTSITIGTEFSEGIQPETMGFIDDNSRILFQSSACTGTPGLFDGPEKLSLFKPPNSTPYYGYAKADLTKLTTYNYMWDSYSAECIPIPGGANGYPITIVPAEQIPFTIPISLPVRFQYESGSSFKPIIVPAKP